MVGFGSSLRLARRPGWEGAYLDYETLKLLLSQIEAVYEEEGHARMSRENSNTWDMDMLDLSRRKPNHRRKKRSHTSGKRDYKEELFLESNSDAAYLSVEADDFTTTEEEDEGTVRAPTQSNIQPSAKPFKLSYSHEASSSEEEQDLGCIPKLGGTKTSSGHGTSSKKTAKRRRRGTVLPMGAEEEDSFYNVTANTSRAPPNTFFLGSGGNEDEATPTRANLPVSSIDYSASLQYFPTSGYANESTSLLPTATRTSPTTTPNLFTFSASGESSLTPPSRTRYPGQQKSSRNSAVEPGFQVADPSSSPGHTAESATSSFLQLQQPQFDAPQLSQKKATESQRRRRQRRRQKLRVIRARRERKVPRHIRIAHAKARAITERFLGLLRAETEKVLLFAQSRLGELADTAGSLRFPSFEEEYNHRHAHKNDSRTEPEYEYPLSDRGMHPSASSSSDDGGGLGGGPKWTDSSSEEEKSNPSVSIGNKSSGVQAARSGSTAASAGIPKVFSGGGLSDDTANKSSDYDSAIASRRDTTARTRDLDNIQIVRRQIAHFAELRKNRALFQRNDQILGEDMLFLSAVEEADAYTAVGVELIHVLKYISVNLIAVRKICRKHDRLLMNRMLGGYYQRVRTREDAEKSYSHALADVQTLGGLVARVSGDIYEAHPALIGQMNHYKLVGVYDRKIQKLANSRTVQVVSSCLALSLSEYEVARSRADALTRLNSGASVESGNPKKTFARKYGSVEEGNNDSDAESWDDPPSTASSISLTRLRFTIMSIFALREASRSKLDIFTTYLSRSVLTFTGHAVTGEGLDGCSRETLDFIVAYNPDAALLFDSSVLYDAISHWSRLPMADVMVSALAVAKTPESLTHDAAMLSREEKVVANAVSVAPESKNFIWKRILNGQFPTVTGRRSVATEELPPIILRLNRMSCFLFMMNYFISHSTAAMFVKSTGAPSALSAIVIGITNVSAMLVSLLHCRIASREPTTNLCRFNIKTVRRLLVLSSLMGIAGNSIHAVAINKSSVALAVLGRFVIGFSSAEILNREILAACVPKHLVAESASLMLYRVVGITAGLFVGSITVAVPIAIQRLGVRTMQGSSWLMMLLWLMHFIRVLVRVRLPFEVPAPPESAEGSSEENGREATKTTSRDSGSDSSTCEVIGSPSSMLRHSSSDPTIHDPITTAFGNIENVSQGSEIAEDEESTPLNRDTGSKKSTRRQKLGFLHLKTFGRFRKLLSFHVGIPLSILVFLYVSFSLEVFFTATPLITGRYFSWSGARAGSFLGFLSILILPITFVCEIIARRYEERTVLKRSFLIVGFGLFVMINFQSLFSLVLRAPKLFSDTEGRPNHPYDWRIGVFQYSIGLLLIFTGLIAMQGASLSLLSKTAPMHSSRSIFLNVGTIVAFVGMFARFAGDVQIVMIDLSHKLINTDIVNCLVMPLILVCLFLAHLVNKHFFFLM